MEERKEPESYSDPDNLAKLKDKFQSIRNEWTNTIHSHLDDFKEIGNINNLQPAVLRDRQIIIEQKHKMQEICEKLSRTIKENSRTSYLYYNNDASVKTKSFQALNVLVEGDVAPITEKFNVLSNHISFLGETLQTIDHILYGIKYRVKLEDYR